MFALSWRLDTDTTSVSASTLSPGIGFVDTDESETETEAEAEGDSTPKFLRRRTLSQAEEIWGELQDDGMLRRHRDEEGGEVNERTGLLKRSESVPGFGRRRWGGRDRRGGYMFPRVGSHRRQRRAQEAMGGWWKLKWWKPSEEGEAAEEGGGYGTVDEEARS